MGASAFLRGLGDTLNISEASARYAEAMADMGIRNVTTGAGSAADTITKVLVPDVIMTLRKVEGLRSVSGGQSRESMGGQEGIQYPNNNDTAVARMLPEGTPVERQDAAFGSINSKADRWSSGIIPITNQTLQDTSVDLLAVVRQIAAERMVDGQGRGFAVGGSNDLKQVNSYVENIVGAFEEDSGLAGGFSLKGAVTKTAVTEAELRSIWAMVHGNYRAPGVGRWVMSTSFYLALLGLKSAAADNERLVRRGGDRNEDTLFANPITLDDNVPAFSSSVATGTRVAGFGAFGGSQPGYAIDDISQGSQFKLYDGDVYKAMDSVGVEFVLRTAARPIDYNKVAVVETS